MVLFTLNPHITSICMMILCLKLNTLFVEVFNEMTYMYVFVKKKPNSDDKKIE